MRDQEPAIAAIATAPGQGAIAIIRVTGAGAGEVVSKVFTGRGWEKVKPRVATRGRIVDAQGRTLDDVVLTRYVAPSSYTGEDLVEVACHGGILVTSAVFGRVLEAGARPAAPGEFTRRAFANGKMDLTQAEAVMDLIGAQTDLALRAANEQLSGRLGSEILAVRDGILSVLAHVEAFIDFPDEDIDPDTGEAIMGRIDLAAGRLGALMATAEQGRLIREGARTVICGAPNVGKSSLLNLLLGFERAIVSDLPGTTRDTIEEVVNLKGLPLRLVDTAGMRQSDDALERAGIRRTEQQLETADLILEVVDGSAPPDQPRAAIPDSISGVRLVVANKADLGLRPEWTAESGSPAGVSCKTGAGIDSLADAVVAALTGGQSEGWGGGALAISTRHKHWVSQALDCLVAAREALASGISPEFVAIDLRSALDALGQVVGLVDTEDLLDQIFSSFCIGK
ncbi:tRNA uridine-5-carboxymethylaminomethyl(34) synthesis GTPase MnmE [soil metagenome]